MDTVYRIIMIYSFVDRSSELNMTFNAAQSTLQSEDQKA